MFFVSNFVVYSIITSPYSETAIGTLSSSGRGWSINLAGKLWYCNGVDFVKFEKNNGVISMYNVGLPTPVSGAAAKLAGGSLADGVYGVYLSYARKNTSGQYLYSYPYSLGNVTTSAGDLSVQITGITPSADPQVTHNVIWMTDADGAVPYYYGEVLAATTTITVTSAANRLGSVRMDVNAASNAPLSIVPDGLFAFDDKIYVWDENTSTVYWSLKTDVNTFDLERFPAANFRTLSATIDSMFSVGDDLFFNHINNGVTKAPAGDMTSVFKRVERRFWFLPLKTDAGRSYSVPYKGIVWGLTNDGFRYFDGQIFSDDLSFHVKPDIDKIIAGASSTYMPAAIAFRRSGKRTELRLSYRDIGVSYTNNNSQLVFNLDFFVDPIASSKTWEFWENGFCEYVIYGGAIFGTQSVESGNVGGMIVSESGVADNSCYAPNGTKISTLTAKQLYVLTRTHIDRLDAITIWGPIYTLATSSANISGNIIIFDANNTKIPFIFTGVNPTLATMTATVGLVIPFVMTGQYPQGGKSKTPINCRGNSVAIEITQTSTDDQLFIYSLQLPRAQQVLHDQT